MPGIFDEMRRRLRPGSAEPNLPDGLDSEPPGWRDRQGRSPVDTLREYVADRCAFEQWAAAEHRHMSTSHAGGQMTEGDLEISRSVSDALDRIRDRYLSPSGRDRAGGTIYSVPPEYDPRSIRIRNIRRVRASRVEIATVHEDLHMAMVPRKLRQHDFRYDFVRIDDEWRLDNRLALFEDRRPIGGLV